MNIEDVCSLEPKEFLERVKATPYPWKERGLDLYDLFRSIVKDAVLGACLPLESYFIDEKRGIALDDYFTLDKSSIDNLCENDQKYKDKLIYIFNTANSLAEKMGVANVKVGLNFKGTYRNDFAVKTPDFSLIGLDSDILDRSDEEIAFTIGHELAHLKQWQWVFTDERLDYVKIAIDLTVVAVILISNLFFQRDLGKTLRVIGVRTLVQGFASLIFRKLQRHQEQRADAKACAILNSSAGMVQRFYNELRDAYGIKHANLIGISEEESKSQKRKLTPQGNCREDDDHPPLTKRLEYALNFKPRQGSLGS